MANHLRQQIRAAVVATLTGLATTGANVYASRTRALPPGTLPALRVFTGEEKIDMIEPAQPRLRQRQLEIVVEAVVNTNTAYDDLLDEIVKEVELALDANNGLGGLVKAIEPHEYSRTQFSDEGDTVVGVQEMRFMALYFTRQGAPDVLA